VKYNKPKRLALDESAPIGMRYCNLLRCVSFVAEANNEKFWQTLNFLDSGFIFEEDNALASYKITNAIRKLDDKRSTGVTNKNSEQRSETVSTTKSNKRGLDTIASQTTSIIGNFLKSFGLHTPEDRALTEKEIEQLYKSEFNELFAPLKEEAEGLYELFVKKLKHLEEVIAFPPQKREKSWNSVLGKIKDNESDEHSKGIQNIKSVRDIQDLIGLRIVTVFEEDIERVEKVILKNFKVKRIYTPKYGSYKPNYPVRHVIIKRKLFPTSKTTFKKPISILIEVQIMTLAQFTFAMASHSLIYKNELPKKLKETRIRSLQKVSALLECADTELSRNQLG
jgi:ppGpp synthetase/RelA/SpoT-type nucleotidyltranferase